MDELEEEVTQGESAPIGDVQSYGCQKSSSTHCAEHGGASEPARDTFPLNAPPRGSPSAFLYWGVGIMEELPL